METKEAVLLKLIQGPEAQRWAADRNGWDSPMVDACTWEGIQCNPLDQSVTAIELPNVGIDGTIPSALNQLQNLQTLNLFGNKLKFGVPKEVLELPLLVSVNLGMNELTGSIPKFKSKHLESLSLPHNRLKGELPDRFSSTNTNLVFLDLSSNHITGTFPESILDLHGLERLNLAFNMMHGTLPFHLGKLETLRSLALNDNAFFGTLPHTLPNLSSLADLFVQNNKFSGTVPESISELDRLENMFLNENKFTGTVPLELCQRTYNRQFFAELPLEIKQGTPSLNGCNAVACPINTKSKNGVFPCTPCPTDAVRFTPYLGWAHNCLNVNEKAILDRFHVLTHGEGWTGSKGWGDPSVPLCDYEGVDCNEGGHVVNITLSGMNLQGEVPESLGRLKHLRRLDLSDNRLIGIVPSDLRHCPLEELDLTGNLFEGPLPPLLCMVAGVNNNGYNGEYKCDVLLCPENTFHWSGRAPSLHGSCIPCPSNHEYLGQKTCQVNGESLTKTIGTVARDTNWPLYGSFFVATLVFLYLFGLFVKRRVELHEQRLDTGYYVDNGSYAGYGEYGVEELTVMSYPDQTGSLPGMSRVASGRRMASGESTAASEAEIRQRRTASPEDDPDTQDLWLDVPKIA